MVEKVDENVDEKVDENVEAGVLFLSLATFERIVAAKKAMSDFLPKYQSAFMQKSSLFLASLMVTPMLACFLPCPRLVKGGRESRSTQPALANDRIRTTVQGSVSRAP